MLALPTSHVSRRVPSSVDFDVDPVSVLRETLTVPRTAMVAELTRVILPVAHDFDATLAAPVVGKASPSTTSAATM